MSIENNPGGVVIAKYCEVIPIEDFDKMDKSRIIEMDDEKPPLIQSTQIPLIAGSNPLEFLSDNPVFDNPIVKDFTRKIGNAISATTFLATGGAASVAYFLKSIIEQQQKSIDLKITKIDIPPKIVSYASILTLFIANKYLTPYQIQNKVFAGLIIGTLVHELFGPKIDLAKQAQEQMKKETYAIGVKEYEETKKVMTESGAWKFYPKTTEFIAWLRIARKDLVKKLSDATKCDIISSYTMQQIVSGGYAPNVANILGIPAQDVIKLANKFLETVNTSK